MWKCIKLKWYRDKHQEIFSYQVFRGKSSGFIAGNALAHLVIIDWRVNVESGIARNGRHKCFEGKFGI